MPTPPDHLQAHQLRFVYEVATPLTLQPNKGSALRGALLGALRGHFCVMPGPGGMAEQDSPLCAACTSASACPIAYLMANRDEAGVLGRGQEVPHPYVVEPPLSRQTVYQPGERLEFGLTLFGNALHTFPYLLIAAQRMGEQGLGLGRERGRLALREIWQVNPIAGQQVRLFHHQRAMARMPSLAVTAAQVREFAADLPSDGFTVRFLTPARLTAEGKLVQSGPPLALLIHRLLERLWMLAAVYAAPEGDDKREAHIAALREWRAGWPQLLAEADKARMVGRGAGWQELERYSSRHDRKLEMGGLLGEARYVGDIAGLREILAWGQLAHVGKYAVAGNGWFEIDC